MEREKDSLGPTLGQGTMDNHFLLSQGGGSAVHKNEPPRKVFVKSPARVKKPFLPTSGSRNWRKREQKAV